VAVLYIAGCIITDQQGRILLLHRNRNNHVQWEVPGGKIDPDEDPLRTATREAQEELGVTVEIVGKLGDKHFTEHLAAGTFTNHFTWYRATLVGDGEPKVMEPYVYDDVKFFAIEDLKKMDTHLSAATRDFLVELDAGRIRL
jgi:8-oxo-dGTP pyrophosphatase MutT (NUDIX family)